MRLLPVLALFLAGCTPSLGENWADSLTEKDGCGDVFLYAANVDDTIMLSFQAADVVAAAGDAAKKQVVELAFPDEGVVLVVEQGTKVSDAACDDVIENGGPDVTKTWTATSGTGTLAITPTFDKSGNLQTAAAVLELSDIDFEDDAGEQTTLTSMNIAAQVGWYPG
jgi:hypothetical protein